MTVLSVWESFFTPEAGAEGRELTEAILAGRHADLRRLPLA